MKKNDLYIMCLAFAVVVVFLTAFAFGFGKFCYKKGFADGVGVVTSQYHK